MKRTAIYLITVAIVVVLFAGVAKAEAQTDSYWQTAETIRSLLFDAQSRLYRVGDDADAVYQEAARAALDVLLLLITNWFFHKAYWTDWMARFHRQKKDILGGMISGQALGLFQHLPRGL